MANPAVQSRFDGWVEGDPAAGLITAYDELRAVEDGLNGLMNLIGERGGKTVRVDRNAFHFAMEPIYFRLRAANELLDRARRQIYPPT